MSVLARAGAVLAMLTVGAASVMAQNHDWQIDKMHSEANFAITHLGISTVHGSFHNLSGVVHFDPANPASWGVDATIDVSTVDTGVGPRDTDLKSADFFNVANFPTMTFKSTSVKKDAAGGYLLVGDLTMHGVTKPVTLHLETSGKEVTSQNGKSVHRGFNATTTIDRRDFGIGPKFPEAALSYEVKIEINIDASQQVGS
jgi:polyisoprenoid-binding protein YceI